MVHKNLKVKARFNILVLLIKWLILLNKTPEKNEKIVSNKIIVPIINGSLSVNHKLQNTIYKT